MPLRLYLFLLSAIALSAPLHAQGRRAAPAAPVPAAPAQTAQPANASPQSNPEQAPALDISVNGDLISVFAVAAQADLLFTELGKAAGVGVIVDDTVGRREGERFSSRKITVRLTDKLFEDVIGSICTAYGLSHSVVDGTYMISEGIPKNPSSYLVSDIDSVTTQYVVSSDAKSLLPAFLQDHVRVNQEQNAVILSAPPEVLAKFREDVKQFDVPAAQIMIDVMMVELTDSGARELGLDVLWSNAGRSVQVSTSSGEIITSTLSTLANNFTAQIRALEEQRKARVHANPRIATVSGQRATIFVGRQKYLGQPVQRPGGQGSSNFIDAGIRLDMTPWTGGDGEIIAEVSPEVSVLSAPDPITNLPEKTTRRAETLVRVRDGDTIIIGGLNQREVRTTKSRIPVLGHLPLIGSLFTRTGRSDVTTELVVFITPRILTGEEALTDEQRDAVSGALPGIERSSEGESQK